MRQFPSDSLATITTAGIAADAAATTATAVATAAPTVAGATDTTAAYSHVQAQAVALVRLHSGLSVLGQYLRRSGCRLELWGDNWSRIRDPGDMWVRRHVCLRGYDSYRPGFYTTIGNFGHLKVWSF